MKSLNISLSYSLTSCCNCFILMGLFRSSFLPLISRFLKDKQVNNNNRFSHGKIINSLYLVEQLKIKRYCCCTFSCSCILIFFSLQSYTSGFNIIWQEKEKFNILTACLFNQTGYPTSAK